VEGRREGEREREREKEIEIERGRERERKCAYLRAVALSIFGENGGKY
jgi:hypothetical protein